MLRGIITPFLGDEITNTQYDSFFTKTYTYSLPEEVNGVNVKPEDIEIIAFVTENQGDVLNVTGCKPDYCNFQCPLEVSVDFPDVFNGLSYGFNFVELVLTNHSNERIDRIDFKIKINNDFQKIRWNGVLKAFDKQKIWLDLNPYKYLETNRYEIYIENLNGVVQECYEARLKGSFKKPLSITSELTVEIQTDLDAADNTYVLRDACGHVVKEFGPYLSGIQNVYSETVHLEKNQFFCLEVMDKWADGTLNPNGYYKIYDDDGNLVFKNEYIKEFGCRTFFYTSDKSDIQDLEMAKTEDIMGITQNQSFLEVKFQNEKHRVFEIYSLDGCLLDCFTFTKKIVNIPIEKYFSSTYILRIIEENKIVNHKFCLR